MAKRIEYKPRRQILKLADTVGDFRESSAHLVHEGSPIPSIELPEDNYLGVHVQPLEKEKARKKKFVHPVFLYTPDGCKTVDDFERLNQIVPVYKHTIYDFEFNAKNIISHYKTYYGTQNNLLTIGQSIQFRVQKDGEVFELPLFQFFSNYTLLLLPICLGADMTGWKPWVPQRWTNDGWMNKLDEYIRKIRPLCNMRKAGELIEWCKFLCNLFCAKTGERLGLSISNNDFLEVAKRSKEAYESMTCTFKIPDDCTPAELEKINRKRTSRLLDIISAQTDLPISVYTRNNLFNPGQFREFAVHMGYKPDLMDHTIPMTSATNIIMGLNDPVAFMVDAYGGRKAEVLKLLVSDAGAFERSLSMLMSGIREVDINYECESSHFRIRDINSYDMLQKLEGRVATLDPKSDTYFIVDPENDALLGKRLYLKTPITCTHPLRNQGYICQACYGMHMAPINCDVHIGRLAALNLADEIEQKLLSAKHALATDTDDVSFTGAFLTYFSHGSCQIWLNDAMIRQSIEDPESFSQLYLEFRLGTMVKLQDGEGRAYDRAVHEIVVYDAKTDTHTIITEENGNLIYLSPEFVIEYFRPAALHKGPDDPIRIPFTSLIDSGEVTNDTQFEYQFHNNGISKPLEELQHILENSTKINQFNTYDECLNVLLPLFAAAGIHLPELQQELLVSQLIKQPNGQPVDWTLENPEYQFYTIDKSIQTNPSALTSILYHETSRQLSGAYGTFEKSGTSQYDWFILDQQQ